MMFSFKKKKQKATVLLSPVTGKCISLEEVPDKVFSTKMMGDGIAFDLEEGTIFAPADGKITFIAETRHAIGMTLVSGVEILIHVGLDTVKLDGKGFNVFVEIGQEIKAGAELLEIDIPLMSAHHLQLITPLIVMSNSTVTPIALEQKVTGGKTAVLTL
ncbi:PTS sugar transporter subunit IIA [Listeria rocourtiae]|uniref:PTS sugar transporter subunit IIA n=1 Tax=Listeria rocourtiae TaxID=647910 RepID=UPI0016282EF7|nr:PTS glucose transporter subunit IIA [Listeria rocourtiae]